MKAPKLTVVRAVGIELAKLGMPVVLRYDVARVAWQLYAARRYEGQDLGIRRAALDMAAFKYIEGALMNTGVLQRYSGVPGHSAYALFGASLSDGNSIVLSLDPFCYLSHLSAMEFHGLTDRMPEQIYISTPAGAGWLEFAEARMVRDLGEHFGAFRDSDLPLLRRPTLGKVGGRSVHRHASRHPGAFRTLKDSNLRVATIGRTFLDMLREPRLCGGIAHVIDVFRTHAPSRVRLICDELDQHGGAIDKVRAGFLLEEVCHISDARIAAWVSCARRGGSRKLDPSADYEPTFSERWMLSINVPIAQA